MNFSMILIGLVLLIVVIILLTLFLIPGMAIFNRFSDEKYQADEKDLLTGTLLTGIDSLEATGEVMTTFATEARKTMPARIFTPNKDNVSALKKGSTVLIIETREGIAYVIPYQEMLV